MNKISFINIKKKTIVIFSVSATALATLLTIVTGVYESINFFSKKPELPNISGEWIIVNTIKSSDKKSFVDLSTTFKVFMQQNELQLRGDGEKIKVGNKYLPYSQRVRTEMEGKVYNDSVRINFKEFGIKRTSVGLYSWKLSNDSLKGVFRSTASSARGPSIAIKIK
jgi:hypothetical protein